MKNHELLLLHHLLTCRSLRAWIFWLMTNNFFSLSILWERILYWCFLCLAIFYKHGVKRTLGVCQWTSTEEKKKKSTLAARRPSHWQHLSLLGRVWSPGFPEWVCCKLGPPTQALCSGVWPDQRTALRTNRRKTCLRRSCWSEVTSVLASQSAVCLHVPSFFESTKNVCLLFCFLSASRRWSSPFSLSIFWEQKVKKGYKIKSLMSKISEKDKL